MPDIQGAKYSVAEALNFLVGATGHASITNNNTTNDECRAIRVGVSAATDFDFYVGGSWASYGACQPAELIPIHATGARKSADSSAPSQGEIVFLY